MLDRVTLPTRPVATEGPTPGDWRVVDYPDTRPATKWVFADNWSVIAKIEGGTETNWSANARLISAAPDLLTAIKGLMEYFIIEDDKHDDAYIAAMKAVEKAEGKKWQ